MITATHTLVLLYLKMFLTLHPLYVSNTQITENTTTKSLEIVCKMFVDDAESAINASNKTKKIDLYATPTTTSNTIVLAYLAQHLQLSINNAKVTYNLVGYEHKKGTVWCYMEVANTTKINSVLVTNNLLYDVSTKQINIVELTINGKQQTSKIAYPESVLRFNCQ